MLKLAPINWSVSASLITLLVPITLGGVATYMQLSYNVTLTSRELLLINSIQFVSSLWFGWVISFIFSERNFQDRQRKFAISAYRRIKEIENATDRILQRIRLKEGAERQSIIELDALREMTIGLQATVRSSKADWGDIIGEEIRTLEQIENVERSAEIPDTAASEKVEGLLSKLPLSLEIDARQKLSSEEKISTAAAIFKKELQQKGYLLLTGFWDASFEKDIFNLPIGTPLQISMDDVDTRVGALVAHTHEGETVGVIVNATDLCDYEEFVRALVRAIGRSRFSSRYTEKGELFKSKRRGGPAKTRERHYFEIAVGAAEE